MSRRSSPRLAFVAAIAVLLFVHTWHPWPLAPGTPDVVRAMALAQDAAAQALAETGQSFRRARVAAVTIDQLPPQATFPPPAQGRLIRLNLFDDVVLTAEFERFNPNPTGVTWVGRVQGVPDSTVTLVYGDGLLTAGIDMPGAQYGIRPASERFRTDNRPLVGEAHVLVEYDQTVVPQELAPIPVVIPESERLAADAQPQYDSAGFIDVMVLYTPAAQTAAGGAAAIQALINLGISETNTAYANSGVIQRIRLAHMASVGYTETGNFNTDLNNLQTGAGTLSGVAGLRNTHAADLVVLILAPGASCGLAYFQETPSAAFESFGFSVVSSDCISPAYSFAHELGHNMGLRHDWFVDAGVTPYTYAHGHVSTAEGNRWRTIMAYNDLCAATGANCPRPLRWSNPDIPYNGLPSGIAAGTRSDCTAGSLTANTCDADERLTLNNTANIVANFRQSQVPGSPGDFSKLAPSSGTTGQTTNVSLTWQTAATATSYEYCVDTTDNYMCDGSWTSVGGNTAVFVQGLSLATTYYWQVRAVNAVGATEANNHTWWRFSTLGGALYDPSLQAPRCFGISNACDSGTLLVGSGTMANGHEPNAPNTIGGSCGPDGSVGGFQVTESVNRVRVYTVDGQPLSTGKVVTVEATVWIFDNSFDRVTIFSAPDAASPVWHFVDTLTPAGTGEQILTASYVLPPNSPAQAVRVRVGPVGSSIPCVLGDWNDHDDLVFAVATAPVLTNNTFAAGTTGWLQFATPDMSYMVSQVTDGVFEFYRRPPPPGTANQALVFQETGAPLAADTALFAQFWLGNSDSVRKRISVLVHDSDFSDLSVCTFWLPANLPLTPYTMRTHNTKPWNNATISFYAASANPIGNTTGFYRLDDVVLSRDPGAPLTRTDCVDPTTPAPPGGADGPELLVNGTFGSGSVAPGWSLFGQIQGQVTAGVFEFLKLAGAPAGVILQPTSQAMTAGQRLTATFQLGNSSPVRKRVTVILHDNNFSDLSACTFWLAPNQPLSTYTYRTFATQAWSNATLSVYPATVGAHQWIRLDNVTLRRTPSSVIVGTECLEPGASPDSDLDRQDAVPVPVALMTREGDSPEVGGPDDQRRVSTDDGRSASEGPTDGDGWMADGFTRDGDGWVATADAVATLTRAAPLDLRAVTDARLTFESWLTGASARARVEVSLDGETWLVVHIVDPSDTWMPVEVDLAAWTGHRVHLRFVVDGTMPDVANAGPEVWRLKEARADDGP